MDYARIGGFDRKKINKVPTPQSQPIRGRETEMRKNAGGGYGFVLDDFMRTYRFMILGTEGGSFYISEDKFTKDALVAVGRAVNEDPRRVTDMAAEILREGRAFKQDPTLFVLALCASYKVDLKETHREFDSALAIRQHALNTAISSIRQSTQLFHYMKFVQEMRGWGRGLRNAFSRWYLIMPEDKLAVQVSKYKNRDGVTHRDMLRMAHPKWPNASDAKAKEYARSMILQYAARPKETPFTKAEYRDELLSARKGARATDAMKQIAAAEELLHITDTDRASIKYATDLIRKYELTHEMVSGELKNSPEVWAALAEHMPITATLRNLAKMTAIGLLSPLSQTEQAITARLLDPEQITKSRVHPMQILIALRQYEKGRGEKGSLVWTPSARIRATLDDAFPLAFGNVQPSGKRIASAVDVSNSMWSPHYATVRGRGMDGWLSADVAAAMAFITIKTDPNAVMMWFHTTSGFDTVINRKSTLSEVTKHIQNLPRGGTDTGAPLARILADKVDVDAVVTYTDNETWAGKTHVVQLHKRLQDALGHEVRFINCATSANATTDVDPTNPNMLEMVGFDASAPRAISEFVAGRL